VSTNCSNPAALEISYLINFKKKKNLYSAIQENVTQGYYLAQNLTSSNHLLRMQKQTAERSPQDATEVSQIIYYDYRKITPPL
jgi:hypothetical protein